MKRREVLKLLYRFSRYFPNIYSNVGVLTQTISIDINAMFKMDICFKKMLDMRRENMIGSSVLSNH